MKFNLIYETILNSMSETVYVFPDFNLDESR
jgi:hypothetical protein